MSVKTIAETRATALKLPFAVPLLFITVGSFAIHLLLAPSYIEYKDGLHFARALDFYSLADSRPHWPGYPVYIWAGRLVNMFVGDSVRALHTLSALATALCAVPIGYLARGWTSNYKNVSGLLAALLWSVLPLSLIDGTEMFSDPLALLLSLCFLWLCWLALNAQRPARYLLLAASLAGFTLGVRLSYVALLFPLLYTLLLSPKKKNRDVIIRLPGMAAVFLGAVSLWLGWQILADDNFIAAATEHLQLHFGVHGGSVTTEQSLSSRPLRFFSTLGIYGLGTGTTALRLLSTLLWSGLSVAGLISLVRRQDRHPVWLLATWVIPYALWVFFSHDVDLPRYFFPLVAVMPIGVAIGSSYRWSRWVGAVLLLCVAGVSLPLALEHRTTAPAPRQLAEYLAHSAGEERLLLLSELGEPYDPEAFVPPGGFTLPQYEVRMRSVQDTLTYKNAGALHDLDAYAQRQQVAALSKRRDLYLLALEPVDSELWQFDARFCRNPHIKSREFSDLWLYRALTPNTPKVQSDTACHVFSERIVDVVSN